MPIFAEHIRTARESKGLSQHGLARRIGDIVGREVVGQTISNWENGKYQPRPELLDALVQVTGRPHSFFYGEKSSQPLNVKRKPSRQPKQHGKAAA
jgi:transcriptional regulator with XRE-family HTH domain